MKPPSLTSASGEDAEPLLLDAQRARRFLRELRRHPFITVVFHEDRLVFYVKGAGDPLVDSALRRINDVVMDNDEE